MRLSVPSVVVTTDVPAKPNGYSTEVTQNLHPVYLYPCGTYIRGTSFVGYRVFKCRLYIISSYGKFYYRSSLYVGYEQKNVYLVQTESFVLIANPYRRINIFPIRYEVCAILLQCYINSNSRISIFHYIQGSSRHNKNYLLNRQIFISTKIILIPYSRIARRLKGFLFLSAIYNKTISEFLDKPNFSRILRV